jgi:hypothetical protein
MGDNEYLIQVAASERVRQARARAAVQRMLASGRGREPAAARPPRRRPARRLRRLYGAVASSLISRWRNWRPA